MLRVGVGRTGEAPTGTLSAGEASLRVPRRQASQGGGRTNHNGLITMHCMLDCRGEQRQGKKEPGVCMCCLVSGACQKALCLARHRSQGRSNNYTTVGSGAGARRIEARQRPQLLRQRRELHADHRKLVQRLGPAARRAGSACYQPGAAPPPHTRCAALRQQRNACIFSSHRSVSPPPKALLVSMRALKHTALCD